MGGRVHSTWTKERNPRTLGIRSGRKPGSKDTVPRSVEKSIKAIYAELVNTKPELFREAIIKSLKAAKTPVAFAHIQLAAAYLDGKPTERMELTGRDGADLPKMIVFTHAEALPEPPAMLPDVTITVPESSHA